MPRFLTVRHLVLLLIGCALATILAGAGGVGTLPVSPIPPAVADCGLTTSVHVDVLDDGHTLVLQGDGAEDPGLSLDDVSCLLYRVGTTGAVVEQMDRTRALDGVQEATWAGYTATWTYHPDAGLNILITWSAE